jgi:opacity protein-like surface antigen
VKAEYLYVDFQNETIGPGTFKLIENVVRGGVNYRF